MRPVADRGAFGFASRAAGSLQKRRGLSKEGLVVTRELRCAELMPGCDFVAQGSDDSDVMKKAAAHAKSVHRMAAISMDVEKKARAAIRNADAEAR
jgi:predicted small metal-binding protein